MNLVAILVTAALQAPAAKHTAMQKQFVCAGNMAESHYASDPAQTRGSVKQGSITIRLDVAARKFAVTQHSDAFDMLCNGWVVCDGAERAIQEVWSNSYVLAKVHSKDEAFERSVELSIDRMKPAIEYEAESDQMVGTGGLGITATLNCTVTDVTPEKPLY
jgi:hypothetical protein